MRESEALVAAEEPAEADDLKQGPRTRQEPARDDDTPPHAAESGAPSRTQGRDERQRPDDHDEEALGEQRGSGREAAKYIAAFVGVGGLFLAAFAAIQKSAKIVAVGDPRIKEALVHENY
mgnify:CR=1 FL=1